MLKRLSAWLDHRTGCRKLMQALLIEHIPGGAKWRYVWGSCLAFVFAVQLITGILLMTAYSPGDSTAWSSVFFIQYEMDFGWLIRGLHHFGSQTMVVLLGLHMLQVVIAGAHLPPREVNWWLGLLLMAVVLALSLTGYLLPWDQKGYYATQVATNIAGNIPGIGSFLQKVIVGGPEYGNHTLTRFYALHVGVLPPLMIVLVIAHLAVFRRHGVTAPAQVTGDGWFWPAQAFKDLVMSLLIFGVMLAMVVFGNQASPIERPAGQEPNFCESLVHGGRDGRGANLDAPADPETTSYPARPEWYFLFLFQLLKYFPGDQETLATVVIPNGVGLLLFLLPLLGYGWMRKLGHALGVLVVVAFLAAVSSLTYLALAADEAEGLKHWLLTKTATVLVPSIGILVLFVLGIMGLLRPSGLRKTVFGIGVLLIGIVVLTCGSLTCCVFTDQVPAQLVALVKSKIQEKTREQMTEKEQREYDQATKYQRDRGEADVAAMRSVALAHQGIPETGGRYLLRNDPLTKGPALFSQYCATCHSHADLPPNDKANPTASDLTNFGSKAWILDFLKDPDNPRFFGRTRYKGGTMSSWAKNASARVKADFPSIAAWLALHPRPASAARGGDEFAKGYKLFASRCIRCHTYNNEKGDDSETKGPDFTGYGDSEWIRVMVMAPDDSSRYGRGYRNGMPLFRNLEGPGGEVAALEVERVRNLLLRSAKSEIAKKKDKEPDDIDDTDADFKKLKKQIDDCTKVVHLSDIDRELIIRWLRKDYRVVFGGTPISGPPREK